MFEGAIEICIDDQLYNRNIDLEKQLPILIEEAICGLGVNIADYAGWKIHIKDYPALGDEILQTHGRYEQKHIVIFLSQPVENPVLSKNQIKEKIFQHIVQHEILHIEDMVSYPPLIKSVNALNETAALVWEISIDLRCTIKDPVVGISRHIPIKYRSKLKKHLKNFEKIASEINEQYNVGAMILSIDRFMKEEKN